MSNKDVTCTKRETIKPTKESHKTQDKHAQQTSKNTMSKESMKDQESKPTKQEQAEQTTQSTTSKEMKDTRHIMMKEHRQLASKGQTRKPSTSPGKAEKPSYSTPGLRTGSRDIQEEEMKIDLEKVNDKKEEIENQTNMTMKRGKKKRE